MEQQQGWGPAGGGIQHCPTGGPLGPTQLQGSAEKQAPVEPVDAAVAEDDEVAVAEDEVVPVLAAPLESEAAPAGAGRKQPLTSAMEPANAFRRSDSMFALGGLHVGEAPLTYPGMDWRPI